MSWRDSCSYGAFLLLGTILAGNMLRKTRTCFLLVAFLVPILSGCQVSAEPRSGHSEYWQRSVSLFQTLPQNRVVMVGDSITDSGEWHELLDCPFVSNRGIAADTTAGVLDRLDTITGGAQTFIMLGINDLSGGVPVSVVTENYRQIVVALLASGSSVVIQSTLYPVGGSVKVAQLNEALRSLADELDGVEFVDINAEIAPDGYLIQALTFDGLHPNGLGYAIWADVIRPLVSCSSG